MTLIVKIGTESLMNFEAQKISDLVDDIATIINTTSEKVILVSSGAVGFGKILRPDITDKQLLASIGWAPLLNAYAEKFSKYSITTAGFLVTHADLEDYEDRKNTFKETIQQALTVKNLLCIINENDPFSTEEMQALGRGADNDQNALLIAQLFKEYFGVRVLAIMTNTNGVYRDKDDANSRIERIDATRLTPQFIKSICGEKSEGGTGGMASKLEVARQAGKIGVETYIFNGKDSRLRDYPLDRIGGTVVYYSL